MATLIVSDVHLGAPYNRVIELMSLIRSIEFDRLIILGDLFDRPELHRLKEQEWTFLNLLNDIAEYIDVVWVEGNHDEELRKSIPSMFNINAVSEFRWSVNGKNLIALHGHQFDDYTIRKNKLAHFASYVYKFLRRIDLFINRDIFHSVCYGNKAWQRISEMVSQRALNYGKEKNADFIFCGHTHRAGNLEEEGVQYFNTGCWNDRYCHYVLINDEMVTLNLFEEPLKLRHSDSPHLRFRHAV